MPLFAKESVLSTAKFLMSSRYPTFRIGSRALSTVTAFPPAEPDADASAGHRAALRLSAGYNRDGVALRPARAHACPAEVEAEVPDPALETTKSTKRKWSGRGDSNPRPQPWQRP